MFFKYTWGMCLETKSDPWMCQVIQHVTQLDFSDCWRSLLQPLRTVTF